MTTQFEIDLTLAYSDQRRGLARTAGGLVAQAFAALPHLNEEDVPRLALGAVAVRQAQSAAANLFAAYAGRLAGRGTVQLPGDIPAPEWRSPFITHWKHLKDGDTWADARSAGIRQAEVIGYDSTVRAADHVVAAGTIDRIVGWRRVLVGETCAWCQRVAAQRYRTKDTALRVRHNRCDCEIVPIVGDSDPGRVINAERRDAAAPETA